MSNQGRLPVVMDVRVGDRHVVSGVGELYHELDSAILRY